MFGPAPQIVSLSFLGQLTQNQMKKKQKRISDLKDSGDVASANNHAWGIGLSTFWGRALVATVYAYFDGVYKKDLKKK